MTRLVNASTVWYNHRTELKRERIEKRAGEGRLKYFWGFLIFVWWMICLAVAAVLAVPVIYQVQHADRIYDGVQVADIALDGLTLDEATQAIHDRFTPYPGTPVTIRHEARTWTLSPAELGVSVDGRATAAEAFAVGRRGSTSGDLLAGLLGDLDEQWQARNPRTLNHPHPQA